MVTAVTRNIHQKGYVLKTQGNPGYLEVVESKIFLIKISLKNLIKGSRYMYKLNWNIYIEKRKINTFQNIHVNFPSINSKNLQRK